MKNKKIENIANILIIDDDEELGSMLQDFFKPDNISITIALSGEAGLDRIGKKNFDLVILDIMLPGMNGMEVLKTIRKNNEIPVIMLTARGEEIDRIIGLEIGADDYLSKPFNPRELSARIKAILKRSQSRGLTKKKKIGSITIDERSRKVYVNKLPLKLTGTEFEILRALVSNPGKVISKDELSENILGRKLLPYDRSIDTHISNLRNKLGEASNSGVIIQNQRGIGYILIPDE